MGSAHGGVSIVESSHNGKEYERKQQWGYDQEDLNIPRYVSQGEVDSSLDRAKRNHGEKRQ